MGFALSALLSGCGGASAPSFPTAPVTFNWSPGLCAPGPGCQAFTITVATTGAATKTISGSTSTTVQLSAALATQVLSDVRSAQPLSALPPPPVVPDAGSATVSAGGQTSPNLVSASSGIDATLVADFKAFNAAFP